MQRIFRYTALMLVFFVILACGGGECGSIPAGEAGSVVDAYAINISGVTNVDLKVESRYAFNGLQYGNRMGPLRITQFAHPMDVALHGHGEATAMYIGTTGSDPNSCFVVMGQPLDPFVRLMHLVSPSSTKAGLHVVLGDWTTTNAYDLYVTSPGANLATATPTAANVSFTRSSMDLTVTSEINPGQSYQVRLCTHGTKNVVNDLGSIPAIGGSVTAGWNYVLASTSHEGAPATLLYSLPPFIQ